MHNRDFIKRCIFVGMLLGDEFLYDIYFSGNGLFNVKDWDTPKMSQLFNLFIVMKKNYVYEEIMKDKWIILCLKEN